MLETLQVQNFALIDAVEIDFSRGFNVLTGETGAGKSILVGALNLVLGGRASSEVVREGTARAKIDAVFRLKHPAPRLRRLLAQHDIALEENSLLLSRVISADGRGKAYAGGSLVPVSVLAEIGDELVDLHGQHEHQSLLKPERQMELLDVYAGCLDLAEEVAGQVARLRQISEEIRLLESDDRDRERQHEFLQFEWNEIDEANPVPGELEEIKERLSLATNAETIYKLASQAYTLLYEGEETAAIDAVDSALSTLESLGVFSNDFRLLAEQLAEARAQLEAVAMELREYTTEFEYDSDELERLNARHAQLGALRRKYGESIEDILEHKAQIASQIAAFANRDERLEQLKEELKSRKDCALQAARSLSQARQAASKKLDRQVTAALQELAMKGAIFQTQITPVELGTHGLERIEFLLGANVGEQAKPLRHVASGGEMSRIMLALKSVFASADAIPTLIFDEIDAGVGGAVARDVAEKLRRLAQTHQVICITHLPQIAAVAETHLNVAKSAANGRTRTMVARMEEESRVRELARLLDGSLSEVSVEHARSLLNTSEPRPSGRKQRRSGNG